MLFRVLGKLLESLGKVIHSLTILIAAFGKSFYCVKPEYRPGIYLGLYVHPTGYGESSILGGSYTSAGNVLQNTRTPKAAPPFKMDIPTINKYNSNSQTTLSPDKQNNLQKVARNQNKILKT